MNQKPTTRRTLHWTEAPLGEVSGGVARGAMQREARAGVTPARQRTQYSCMSSSMAMCLQALGHDCTEDEVNNVMGARPMKGAAWEQALACAQHFGCRATLTMPATVKQLKAWTDQGTPVMIAWNPEGRDWSHASVVFDVTQGPIEDLDETEQLIGSGPGLYVWVADPNLPNPEKTVRIVHEDEFYNRWYEKFPNYLVRRPACAIEREITPKGKQVMASMKLARTIKDQWGRQWGPKQGLEGPFLYHTGIVLFYDPREKGGTYYDPSTDMYLSAREFEQMTGQRARTADMPTRRDRNVLQQHEAAWSSVGQEIATGFSRALDAKVAKGETIPGHYASSVNLNYGPTFSTRYITLGLQFGGSTPPNAAMAPSFSIVTFPGLGSRKYDGLPVVELEARVRSVVTNLSQRFLKTLGQVKVTGGGSGKGSQVSVFVDESNIDQAWARIPALGGILGQAVTRVLATFKAKFEANKVERAAELEDEIKDLTGKRSRNYQLAKTLREEGDTTFAGNLESQAYQWGVDILRLQEQLSGITGKQYPRPEFPDQGKWASAEEHLTNIMLGAESLNAKDKNQITGPAPKKRNEVVRDMIDNPRPGGPMKNRKRDVEKGRSRKPKHKKDPRLEASTQRVAKAWLADQEEPDNG